LHSRFQTNLAYHAVPVANDQGHAEPQAEAQGATAQRSPATAGRRRRQAPFRRPASTMTQTEKDREQDEYEPAEGRQETRP
jgi:hypothetical protein